MGGPIDKSQLWEYLQEIEEGMGYLKGNELAYKYLQSAMFDAYGDGHGPDGTNSYSVRLDPDYTFPCPYGDFQVHPSPIFDFVLWIDKDDQNGEFTARDWVDKVGQNAIVEWRSGADWASGLAGYLGELCAQFMDPDAATMRDTCLDLRQQVLQELDAPARDDWAQLGKLVNNWNGKAALSFSIFYENYSSSVAIYALFSTYVFAGMAAATKIINDYQVAALNFVESVRDAMREQLKRWAEFNLPPTDPPPTPAWLAKTEQVASDAYSLLDHVPVVSTVKGYIDKGVSITESVKAIAIDLGADPPHETQPFHAMDSEAAYTKLTETLTKLLGDYHSAMDASVHRPPPKDPGDVDGNPFQADVALRQLQQEKSRYDFSLPSIPDQSFYHSGDKY